MDNQDFDQKAFEEALGKAVAAGILVILAIAIIICLPILLLAVLIA